MESLDPKIELQDLLDQAQAALESGDRKGGAVLLARVLARSYLHPDAWQLIYRYFGGNKPFEQFRYEFTRKFYPDRLELLAPLGETSAQREAAPADAPLERAVPAPAAAPIAEPQPVQIIEAPADQGEPEPESGCPFCGSPLWTPDKACPGCAFELFPAGPSEPEPACPFCGSNLWKMGEPCPACGFDPTHPIPQPEQPGCPFCGDKRWQEGLTCPACGCLVETQPPEETPPASPAPAPTLQTEAPRPAPAAEAPAAAPEMVNFCPRCGKQRDADDLFCRRCGCDLHRPAQPAARQEAPAPAADSAPRAVPPAPPAAGQADDLYAKIEEYRALESGAAPLAAVAAVPQVARSAPLPSPAPAAARAETPARKPSSPLQTAAPTQSLPPQPALSVRQAPAPLPAYPAYQPEPESKRGGLIFFTWLTLIAGFALFYIDPDLVLVGYGLQILTFVLAIVLINHKPSKTNGWVIMGLWLLAQIIGFIVGFNYGIGR